MIHVSFHKKFNWKVLVQLQLKKSNFKSGKYPLRTKYGCKSKKYRAGKKALKIEHVFAYPVPSNHKKIILHFANYCSPVENLPWPALGTPVKRAVFAGCAHVIDFSLCNAANILESHHKHSFRSSIPVNSIYSEGATKLQKNHPL